MKTTTVAGICAVLLVLAGFSLAHLQSRNRDLNRTIATLRLESKAKDAAIETRTKALKEAQQHAQERQKAMEAALQAAGIWSGQQLPDSVRGLLCGPTRGDSGVASGLVDGAYCNPRPVPGQNAGRSGQAAD